MKIMQIIPNFGVGGAEIMCEELINNLLSLGHSVTVVSLFSQRTLVTERIEKNGCEIHYLNKRNGFDLSCIYKLRNLVKTLNPDIIHTHLYAVKYVSLATLGMKQRIVHTVHNVAEKETTGSINKMINFIFFKNKKVIPVALSDEIKDTIVNYYGIKDINIPVILNGVNLKKCIIKKDYSLNNPISLIHVGRFYEQKNHENLIKAFNTVQKDKNIVLKLYGDGLLLDDMISLVKELGLEEKVLFCGVTNDIHTKLNESDIFLLPSKWEGIPISIIEAMGTGMPIIASNVGGVSDMIDSGVDGILIKPDVESIANAISELISDENLRKKIGENAVEKSLLFSSETMSSKYVELYSNIIKK